MKFNRRAAAGALALAMAAASLTACTGEKKDDKSDSETAQPQPTLSSVPLPKDPAWEGKADGAAGDLEWDATKCDTNEGDKRIEGKVKNSSKKARDYNIMIIWLKNGNSSPLGAGRVVVKDVKPGETKDWVVAAKVTAKADKCVPNVYAGQLKK